MNVHVAAETMITYECCCQVRTAAHSSEANPFFISCSSTTASLSIIRFLIGWFEADWLYLQEGFQVCLNFVRRSPELVFAPRVTALKELCCGEGHLVGVRYVDGLLLIGGLVWEMTLIEKLAVVLVVGGKESWTRLR
jgi:hypothetical protein